MSATRLVRAKRVTWPITIGAALIVAAACERDAPSGRAPGDVRQSAQAVAAQPTPKLPARFRTIGRAATTAK